MRRILISEVEGKPALCFDTGLDSRSFAQAKFAQCFTEPGHIVYPDGSTETWKALGVIEENGSMQLWGPPFSGTRLVSLVETSHNALQNADAALQAVLYWIRAKLLLGQTHSSLNPGAAFIAGFGDGQPRHPKGSVFFAPQTLSARCILAEGGESSHYICPDLEDMEAAAFCAGAMLYKVLTGAAPYPAPEDFSQDMREGFFLPPHFASPGLDEKLGALVQDALLLPVEKKKPSESGTSILCNLLKILMGNGNEEAAVSSFFRPLSAEENAHLALEKERFIKKNTVTVKTNRFVMRNKAFLLGMAAAMIAVLFVLTSIFKSRADLPTTRGMDSPAVIHGYYNAIGTLDHTFMEACLKGADKSDIDMVINFFVINKVRQAYEYNSGSSIVPAGEWKESGGELPAPNVLGVTDLSIEHLYGNEEGSQIQYRIRYALWLPNEPDSIRRNDELTLTRMRGNWRITEIRRKAE